MLPSAHHVSKEIVKNKNERHKQKETCSGQLLHGALQTTPQAATLQSQQGGKRGCKWSTSVWIQEGVIPTASLLEMVREARVASAFLGD